MKYGEYKSISIRTDSLLTKQGDTSNIIRYQLQNGDGYADVNDDNAVVIVKNNSGYLFDLNTVVQGGAFTIDFSNDDLANLPSGGYAFQINTHKDNDISKYPDVGFVPFEITNDARVLPSNLVPQITFDAVLKSVDDKVSSYVSTITKGDRGEQGLTGETGKNGSDGKDGKNARNNYNNVLDFGADRTGQNDSTQAFKDALKYNDANSETSVFVPRGTYLVSDNLVLSYNKIIGQSKGSTTIKIIDSGRINLWDKATLTDLTVDLSAAEDGAVAIELGTNYTNSNNVYQYTGGRFNTIRSVEIQDVPTHTSTIGIYAKPELLADLASQTGVWGNVIENVNMNNIGIGIKLDALNRGWINGNSFRDVLIRGFQKYGVAIDSSNSGGMDIQVNMFSGIQVQGTTNTPSDAIAFDIKAGNWNFFSQCSHWDDYSHVATDRDDVIAVNFGTSVQANRYYKVANNTFRDCKFEGNISGNANEIALNNIDIFWVNNEKRANYNGGSMLYNFWNNINKENLIFTDLINDYVDLPEFSPISVSNDLNNGNPTHGYDRNGSFVNIVTGVSGKANIDHYIFGNTFNKLVQSKYLSYSIRFISSASVTISPTMVMSDGTVIALKADTTLSESLPGGDSVLTILVDLSQISLTGIKYIDVVTNIVADASSTFLLRDIKASNSPVNQYLKYSIEHEGNYISKRMGTKPEKWDELNIVLPMLTNFDESLLDVKALGSNYYVKTPIKE